MSYKLKENKQALEKMTQENDHLWQVNNELITRVSELEANQLGNNAIITGIPEQPWESFDTTQQWIHDVIAVAILDKFPDKESAQEAATKSPTLLMF